MTTLTLDAMQTLHGGAIPRRRRGAYCGFLVGAMAMALLTGAWVPAATIYMFTPVTCLLDYAL